MPPWNGFDELAMLQGNDNGAFDFVSGTFYTYAQPTKLDQKGLLPSLRSLCMLRGAAMLQQTEAMATAAESVVGPRLQKCIPGKALVLASGAIAVGTVCEKGAKSTPFLWRWLHSMQSRNPATDPVPLKGGLWHHLGKHQGQLSRQTCMSGGAAFAFIVVALSLLHRSQRRQRHKRPKCCQQVKCVKATIVEQGDLARRDAVTATVQPRAKEQDEEQDDRQPESEREPGDTLEEIYDASWRLNRNLKRSSDCAEGIQENSFSNDSSDLQLEADSSKSAKDCLEWLDTPRDPVAAPPPSRQHSPVEASPVEAPGSDVSLVPMPQACSSKHAASFTRTVSDESASTQLTLNSYGETPRDQQPPLAVAGNDTNMLPVPQDLVPASTLPCDKQPAPAVAGSTSPDGVALPGARKPLAVQSEPALKVDSNMRRDESNKISTDGANTGPKGRAKAKGWVRQVTADLERRCAAKNETEAEPVRVPLKLNRQWPRTDGVHRN
mmetsp:Transcript_25194/g.49384  ORF Transcript_25194/g.49384 Transcript_25194/m.49384 type:complete len:494 (+) Transcript_25194:62-1543(+)|eukprot:CAMPEP_0172675838 /NCGR_PEP_ID=MMETSP1074-20121228/13530_1 /TAXON_ID=2916 /ORGANISM="Ceratium fusus, Strain PA161109" /LENGTH=493 /DNA_ID=CAMNT_0013493355 /DNA_START=66 /DNA_END=1547 /DNA_ORIENTATION=-